jgi:hypothetical protein
VPENGLPARICGSAAALAGVPTTIGGKVLQSNASEAVGVARRALGAGETVEREHEGNRRALMRFVTLAASPLGSCYGETCETG